MLHGTVGLSHGVGLDNGRASNSSQLYLMERELENQIKESMNESETLHEKFQNDLISVREEVERRASERHRHAKRQQAKLEEKISCAEREKADVLQHADLLREQVIVATGDIRLARDRVFELEAEVQSLRTRGPLMVERPDPASVAETSRLRYRGAAAEEQARRAQREASEARQQVGRELAVNQSLQRDVDNARHRLLTVQGSLAQTVEENAGLRRELEAERARAAGGSRRLREAVEVHEAALEEIRKQSARLREQRDSFGQDCAALSTKLHRLRKSEGGRRLFHALLRAQNVQLARGLRAWVVEIAKKKMAHEGKWKQEAHDAEIASLKADIDSAEGRYRDTRKEADALRNSRANVAEVVAKAYRNRGEVAAAIEDRRAGPALKWCFWGWARVAREGDEATAARARSRAAEKRLQSIQTRLSDALGRADQAETELEQNRLTIEGLREDVNRRVCELGIVRIALRAIQKLAVVVRSRCSRLGATRLHKVLKDMQRDQLSRWFCSWIEIARRNSKCRPDATMAMVVVSAEHTCTVGNVDTKALTPTARASSLEAVEEADVQDRGVHEQQAELGRREVRDGKQTTAESIKITGESIVPSELSGPSPNVADEAASHPREIEATIRQDISEGWSIKHINATEPQPGRSTPASPMPRENPWESTMGGSGAGAARSVSVRGTETTRGDSGQFPATGAINSPINASRKETAHDDVGHLVVPPHVPYDLPRLILALKVAIGQELYTAGERLLRCVEADHGEIHGRPYLPATLTGAERAQFRACLEGTANGPIRGGIIVLLRAQESSRADAVELDRQQEKKTWNGGGGGRRGGEGVQRTAAEKNERKNTSVVDGISPSDLASLRTGPMSSSAEKARAARVLRDRLIVILEVAADVWSTHRRPWQEGCFWDGIGLTGRQRAVPNRKGQRLPAASRHLRPAATAFLEGSYTGVYCLDSGAGPRRFWEAMCGPRFVDAAWNIDGQVLEEQLWRLALLVRYQDRGQAVALKRRSRLRRLLDLRVYEILMLYVRNGLIWEGVDCSADANIARGVEHEATAVRSPITVADGNSNPLGPLLVAADRAIQSLSES